jgi:hypothetical protein
MCSRNFQGAKPELYWANKQTNAAKNIESLSYASSNLVKTVCDCLNGITHLSLKRDYELEKRVIDANKVELKLLSTIGSKEMRKWLEKGTQKGMAYKIGQYQLILKTHRPFLPGLSELRESTKALSKIASAIDSYVTYARHSSTPEESLSAIQYIGDQILSHYQNASALQDSPVLAIGDIVDLSNHPFLSTPDGRSVISTPEGTPSYSTLPPRPDPHLPPSPGPHVPSGRPAPTSPTSSSNSNHFTPSTMIELYRMTIPVVLDHEQAVLKLKKYLDWEPGELLDVPVLNSRMNWYSSSALMPFPFVPLPSYVLLYENGFKQGPSIAPLTDEHGGIACTVEIFMDEKKKIVLPVTAWKKAGYEKNFFLFIPPASPYLLMNKQELKLYPQIPVILSDSLEIASALMPLQHPAFIPTAWFGGLDALNVVDWTLFKGHKVQYLMVDHSGMSKEQAQTIAAVVYDKLNSLDISVEVLDFLFDLARPPGQIIPRSELPNPPDASQPAVQSSKKPPVQEGERKRWSNIKDDTEETTYLLDPIIAHNTVSLMYAKPDTGKTWLSLYLACSLACGKKMFDKWTPQKPCKVLYVDGEMGDNKLANRVKTTMRLFNDDEQALVDKNFSFVSICSKTPDLSTEEGQLLVEKFITEIKTESGYREPVSLLILDNLGTLTGFSDSHSSWGELFAWLKDLKGKGTSTIVIHHLNKDGAQRGTETKMAAVDNAFHIKKEGGAGRSTLAMSIHVEKGRDLYGEAKKSFTVEFMSSAKDPKWKLLRTKKDKDGEDENERNERIKELVELGWPDRDIATEVGLGYEKFKVVKRMLGLTKKNNKIAAGRQKAKQQRDSAPKDLSTDASDGSPGAP